MCEDCGRLAVLRTSGTRWVCQRCFEHRQDGHEPRWMGEEWCHTDPKQLQKAMTRIQRIRYKRQLRRYSR